MKKHYLYLTSDLEERIYVGRRTIEADKDPYLDTKYKGSHTDSTYIPLFKIILHECQSFEEIYDMERELIISLKNSELSKKLVNRAIPAKRGSGKSFSTFGLTVSDSTKEKHKKNQTGKKATPGTKQKMSEAHKGKPKNFSKEALDKMSQDKKGENNPSYKGERFNWIHKDSLISEKNLTVLELRDKYSEQNLCETNLYAVKNKRVRQYKGWMLEEKIHMAIPNKFKTCVETTGEIIPHEYPSS